MESGSQLSQINRHDSWNQLDMKAAEPVIDILLQRSNVTPSNLNVIFRFLETNRNDIDVIFLYPEPYKQANLNTGFALDSPESPPRPLLNFITMMCEALKKEQKEIPQKYNIALHELKRCLFLPISLTIGTDGTSHARLWQNFMGLVINFIVTNNPMAIFVALGSAVTGKKPLVKSATWIELPHPNHHLFSTSENIFSLINTLLLLSNRLPINWIDCLKTETLI